MRDIMCEITHTRIHLGINKYIHLDQKLHNDGHEII